ncbi:MAG: cytochrome P450 [Polyangiaceae bacterium]
MTLPPGPDSSSFVQLVRWIREPFPFLDECHARYGDAFTLTIPGLGQVVLVAHPEPVKELFALQSDQFSAARANQVLRPFLGDHSLLLLDGREHMRHRKVMLPAFHGERMAAYGRTMLEMTDASIDEWPMSKPFSLHDPMQEITLRVILRTVFGVAEGARFQELASLLKRSLDLIAWPPMLFPSVQHDLGPWSPWGKLRRIADRITALLLDEIRSARERGVEGRTDILAMLLSARDEEGRPLSDQELHDELITLLVAGHETTATSLAWSFRWILAIRGLADRMIDEINGASTNGELSPEKLSARVARSCGSRSIEASASDSARGSRAVRADERTGV